MERLCEKGHQLGSISSQVHKLGEVEESLHRDDCIDILVIVPIKDGLIELEVLMQLFVEN